jgi:hypothetical protein
MRVQVVEQQAHLHATVGRGHHARQQQLADLVAEPHVVLQVERVAGRVDQGEAPLQGPVVAFEQIEARAVGAMVGGDAVFDLGEGALRMGGLRMPGGGLWP